MSYEGKTVLGRAVNQKMTEIQEAELKEFEFMKTTPEYWDATIADQVWSGDGFKVQCR